MNGCLALPLDLGNSVMETYTYGNFLTSALNAFGSGRSLTFAMALIPAMGGLIVGLIREAAGVCKSSSMS